ncbi:hypothetical protein SAMN05421493_11736 [Pseudobutyrivibrio sp. 49]|uniref:hypothetical protein n=1 Tax=Pseudobutyrivibrio sp. 49 TaxID=1855344 RepID=UPI00088F5A7F|nr:hypothetical protein [Pseudobutyrivibrio sp. 49]SDI52998.1 hypothetical protein SAMN05421493_11736 [Pseudobutyrivibrio sp. 49]
MKQKLLLVCMILTLGLVGCGTDTKESQIPDNPTEDVVVDEKIQQILKMILLKHHRPVIQNNQKMRNS